MITTKRIATLSAAVLTGLLLMGCTTPMERQANVPAVCKAGFFSNTPLAKDGKCENGEFDTRDNTMVVRFENRWN